MQCDYFPTYFCHKVYLKGNFFLQFFKRFQRDILRSRNSNNVQISFRSSQFPPGTIRGDFIVVSLKQVNGGSCFCLLGDSISNRNQEEAGLAAPLPSFPPSGCLPWLVWIPEEVEMPLHRKHLKHTCIYKSCLFVYLGLLSRYLVEVEGTRD